MDGLAQSMAQPQQPAQEDPMAMVEQVVQMLVQGADPEQLLQQGIPVEVIMQAIQVIEQQMAAQQAPDQGLATKSVMGL